MVPSYQEILDIFGAAICAGYASEGSKTSIQELPGSKLITFADGPFKVVDFYFTNPNSIFSSGMTVIYYGRNPVWSMSYQGWYDKKDIPFLKEALLENYRNGVFVGGRGPERFEAEDGRLYINQPQGKGLKEFSGKEQIMGRTGEILGEHFYQGGLLIEHEPD